MKFTWITMIMGGFMSVFLNTSPNNLPKPIAQPVIKITKNIDKKIKINNTKCSDFHISFYTSLANENTNNGKGTDCHGKPLIYGDVADNYLPYGTKIHLYGMGNFIVRDVGSSKYFHNSHELDVFIPRNSGESNAHYYERVSNMGRKVVKGYIEN